MKKTILIVLGLLVFVGASVFTTSCGEKKHKIDNNTVLPFKDKAELDKLLDLPILPEYTIEEYYTKTDFLYGDELFVVCCKFLEEVPPTEVKKILKEVDSFKYIKWHTFDLGRKDNMRLLYDLDTTLTADKKRPDILGDSIHVSVEILCKENKSLKGFEVVFRNNRADYSVVVDRDTLSKVLGVEFPPLTETNRIDETIYFKFDTVPDKAFYQALEKAPYWSVSRGVAEGDYTYYDYDYYDDDVMISAFLVEGDTEFSFTRMESLIPKNSRGIVDFLRRLSPSDDKASKSE